MLSYLIKKEAEFLGIKDTDEEEEKIERMPEKRPEDQFKKLISDISSKRAIT